ncbi:hypothetical protein [Alkalicaulis satelles]|uniref:hypothetical protein n=1 Tax=Alkalicaulis satelles TaxID=2609175 RepID=UPI0018ED1A78|nr:hypothetical protein [Alkalicaulis satelles]
MTRSAPDTAPPAPDSREVRLAEALRANLRRRKAPRRDEAEAGAQAGPGPAPSSQAE